MNDPKTNWYALVRDTIERLTEGEADEIAIMATVACELHHAFDQFHWTGFYRTVSPGVLKVGPYQGGHGCLTIPFTRGVCGAAATQKRTQLVPDVTKVPHHIACASSTRSEIVVPLIRSDGEVGAVLDVDSDLEAAFDETDQECLEAICTMVADRIWGSRL